MSSVAPFTMPRHAVPHRAVPRLAVALLGVGLLGSATGVGRVDGAAAQGPPLPVWELGPAAKAGFGDLWAVSSAARQERVACLGGTIEADTVRLTEIRLLDLDDADSLGARADSSLDACGPPRWIGTVHTHVRSTDDDVPVARFSPGDRAVMSAWSQRWTRAGAFCVLYGARSAHCEVYPPKGGPRTARPTLDDD